MIPGGIFGGHILTIHHTIIFITVLTAIGDGTAQDIMDIMIGIIPIMDHPTHLIKQKLEQIGSPV